MPLGKVMGIAVEKGVPDAIAGDRLETSANVEKTSSSTTYEKKKEIYLGRGGTYRVKFDLKIAYQSDGLIAYGRIYRNGAAVGIEQTATTADFVTKSEDIAGWTAGDLLQLYMKVETVEEDSTCRALQLYTGNPTLSMVDTD